MKAYLAHTEGEKTQIERWQTLYEHLHETAKLARNFAVSFGAASMAGIIGLMHDIGKYQRAFQRRIRGEAVQVDHSTPGAQEIVKTVGFIGAYCVAGHHGGLPDGGTKADASQEATLYARLSRQELPEISVYHDELTLPPMERPAMKPLGAGGFSVSFFIRMLFSCLVDADYLDTERFMTDGSVQRGGYEPLSVLRERLKKHTAAFFPPKNELNAKRCQILCACEAAGEYQRGLYTLTVPTGGGKTLSSLAFALEHAVTHGMERVIYVIPYTSIIEQTARVFREILGEENVLEHHSSYEYDDHGEEADPKRLAAENWDAPVIVTTNVQFFQSLFASKPSRCRKLHHIANSVVIFDEAQMLPQPYLLPCVRAIAELVANYRATCVLCTATQPSLGKLLPDEITMREICPDTEALYTFFRRVRYESLGMLSDDQLVERLLGHQQVLCIVSTRKQAQAVYQRMAGEGCYHLSTLMYPEHRSRTLDIIRARLKQGLSCRVIATSLVEAGVDVDFPVVYRAEAGLDSEIQAGGRCNREGNQALEDSVVYLFKPDVAYRLPAALRLPVEVGAVVAKQMEDIASPEAIKAYFDELHALKGSALDVARIVESFDQGLRSMSFPFQTITDEFRIIDQETHSVLIPLEEGKAVAAALRKGQRSRSLMRQAGRYSVSIYPQHAIALRAAGVLCDLDGGLSVLTDISRYNEMTGLTLAVEMGVGTFV